MRITHEDRNYRIRTCWFSNERIVQNSDSLYDKFKHIGSKESINECDIAFVCVPTSSAEDGSCDTSIVEEVIRWCTCKCIVLRSTVRA